MSLATDPLLAENLQRWQASGQPLRWVEAHSGTWDHRDWLVLLANLRHTEFWPMDPDAVGAVLESLKQEKVNLRRWLASGEPRRWVEGQRGQWDHAAWLALLEKLEQSQFWPLRPDAVGRVLEDIRREWWNLRLWQDSGQARAWVEAHRGEWRHDDWLALLDTLRRSPYWPMDPAAVGEVLEQWKQRYWNCRRWEDSGHGRAWVEARQGRWDHDDWLLLVSELRQSQFWPLLPEAVGRALKRYRRELANLQRWEASGQARQWVESRQGRWDHDDWLALLGELAKSYYWPMAPAAVGRVLEENKAHLAALTQQQAEADAVLGGAWFGSSPAAVAA
jgi:hypothetical protein